MERVTTGENAIVERVLDLLRGVYLTEAEAQRIRCAVGEARNRVVARLRAEQSAAAERMHQRMLAWGWRAAPGTEPPRVVWAEELEAEAVRQGQDGPDPVYLVAPRFGGVEMRQVPVDRPEGAPDALAGLYAIQAGEAAVAGDPPANPDDDDGDDDDPDRTPLVVPFTDEQEGE